MCTFFVIITFMITVKVMRYQNVYLDEEDREFDVYTRELWHLHRLCLLCLLQKSSSSCVVGTLIFVPTHTHSFPTLS